MTDAEAPEWSTRQIIENREVITGDRILAGVQALPHVTYFKRDFLYRPGVWRDMPVRPFWMTPPSRRRVIVVGHADKHLTRLDSALLRASGTKHVFAFNADPVPWFVSPLPLGLTNNTAESNMHRLLGDNEHLIRAYEHSPDRGEFDGSIYVNMTIQNALVHRRRALEAVRGLAGVHLEQPTFSEKGRIDYLSKLRSFNFVLSPQGNGVDTHRTWETLYMGGIPIVHRHPAVTPLLEALPVVLVDDWRELQSTGFLEGEWHRIHSTRFDYSTLRVSFWIDQIAAAHVRLAS